MYWWNSRIEELRRISLKARRAVQRYRRRKSSSLTEEPNNKKYLKVFSELRLAIKKAKTEAWKELIKGIGQDPWGKSYKIVLGKIKQKNSFQHCFPPPGCP